MSSLPLKRGRSSITDDEAKPTALRPERKKPKVMTVEKRPNRSAKKQRLRQLLHRQKKAVVLPGHPLRKAGLNAVPSALSIEGADPAVVSALCIGEEATPAACEGLAHLQETLAAVAEVQQACQSRINTTPNLNFGTSTQETARAEDLESNAIPLPSSSVDSWSKPGAPGNLQNVPRFHGSLAAARKRLVSKLRKHRWHPYSTGIGKRKHEVGMGELKIQGLPIICLGEIESKGSSVIHPSSRPTRRLGETTPTGSEHLPESIGQVIPAIGDQSSRSDTVDEPGFGEFQGVAATSPAEPSGPEFRIALASSAVPSMASAVSLLSHYEHISSAVAAPCADSFKAKLPAMLIDDACRLSQFCIPDTIALPVSKPLPLLGLPAELETLSSEQTIRKQGFPNTQFQDVNFGDSLMEHSDEVFDARSPVLPTQPSSSDIDKAVNTNSASSSIVLTPIGADPDFLLYPYDSSSVTTSVPGHRIFAHIPASPSQLLSAGSDLETGEKAEAALPSLLLDNQGIDLVDISSPADAVSKFGLNIRASLFSNDPVPSPPMSSSAPILTARLPFLPASAACQVEPSKELGVVTSDQDSPATSASTPPLNSFTPGPSSAGQRSSIPISAVCFADEPRPLESQQVQPAGISESEGVSHHTAQLQTVQVTKASSSTDIPQRAGMPRPASVFQLHEELQEPHPADTPRPGSLPQGTDMQGMDVDVDIFSSSDFNGYTGAMDDVQFRPGGPPDSHCCSVILTKIVEMLATPKSPNPRLPKSLREQGRPRQYDVPGENIQLKTCVREYAHHLLGQMPWDVPSEGELLAFEGGRGTGPTAMSFRLALGSQGLANKWNTQAAEVFADAFLAEDELAREFSDRETVLSVFIVHLITLQKRYRQPILLARMTEVEVNGERDKQKQKAREQRKHGLFRRRINATKDYEADHLLRTLSASFWSYCTPEVMSDDETDPEWDGPADQVPHFVKITNWRNPDIATNGVRVDFPTREYPRPQWLLQLSDIERRKLRTRPAIDLDFSQNILRIAARFLHIRHRKQHPLPRNHPALQHIAMSTFPSGFPLENAVGGQCHQTPNEEVLTADCIDLNILRPNNLSTDIPDKLQQMRATDHLSRPIQESLPLPQEGETRFTVPALTLPSTHFSHTHSNTTLIPSLSAPPGITPLAVLPTQFPNDFPPKSGILLRPVPPVPLVGLAGEVSSQPQFFLVNESIEGLSHLQRPYAVALEAVASAGPGSTQLHGTLRVPTHFGHTVGSQSSNVTPFNAGLSTYSTDQKRIDQKRLEPFIRRRSRRFLKKSVEGNGKGS